jgi:peptide/nickel transport system substrate-binding protein
VVAAVSLGLSGCGASDEAPQQTQGTPRKGGSLTVTMPGDAVSFDPAQTSFANVADGNRMAAVYDALVTIDPMTGTVQPKIAESLNPEGGGDKVDTWVLRIREGVRFSDGVAYDAAAVKANWDRHRDPKVKSYQAAATLTIKALNVDPRDPLVLHIALTSPNANFDHIVARSLSFNASPAALRPETVGSLRDKPVGAGPFLLKEWTPNQRQLFTRNTGYWQAAKGLPYLDELVFRVEIDSRRTVHDLGKTSDLTVLVDPENIALGRGNGLAVTELGLNGGAMVLFNTAKGPFVDVRARRAVALALSSSEINEKFYRGTGTPAKSVFSASTPLANAQLTAPENDRAAAQRLFDEVTAHGSRPLAFSYLVPDAPTPVAVAEHIRATLNAFPGVQMSIGKLDVPTFIRTLRRNSDAWSVAMYQTWIDDPDPGIYDMVHSDSAGNFSGYRNPDADTALERARRTTNPEERRNAYTQLQIRLNADVPFWVYQQAVAAAVYTKRVTGVRLFNDGLVHWEVIGISEQGP